MWGWCCLFADLYFENYRIKRIRSINRIIKGFICFLRFGFSFIRRRLFLSCSDIRNFVFFYGFIVILFSVRVCFVLYFVRSGGLKLVGISL